MMEADKTVIVGKKKEHENLMLLAAAHPDPELNEQLFRIRVASLPTLYRHQEIA